MTQNFIEKTRGPCIILAGAGTGKTYSIIEKLKHIIKNNIYPTESILCLTFSNEAVNSLRNRILPILPDDNEPVIRTFHSFCSDLLKKYGNKIGISDKFKILTPEDGKIILHKNFKIPPYNCHKYISAIGTAKDLGITLDTFDSYFKKISSGIDMENLDKEIEDLHFKLKTSYLKEKDKDEKKYLQARLDKLEEISSMGRFLKAWRAYEKIKKIRGMQDYADLNKEALVLLEKSPEIADEFKYIIVDEFQDTNKQQFELLKMISNKNITVVGDLNQSIYRFRGAYKDNFNLFKKYFGTSSSDIFALNKSFRSPNRILKAAHQLIEKNYDNKDECFFVKNANNIEGDKIKVFEMKNAKEETRKALEIIDEELKRGTPPEEICVMFRTHQQSRLLKKSLESQGIEYSSVSSKSLLKTGSVKSAIEYLKIANSIKRKKKGSETSWWSVIHSSNFTDNDMIKIGKFIKDNKDNQDLSSDIMDSMQGLGLTEEGKIKAALITKRINLLLENSSLDIPEYILKSYEILGLEDNPNKENVLCLQKFYDMAQEYHDLERSDLDDFLYHLSIMENLGIEIEAPSAENKGIRIMTQHATKGLEYKSVILTNLAQKRFPIEKITSNSIIPAEISPELKEILEGRPESEKEHIIKDHEIKSQLSEERRLCYVAFTRAKERLYITYATEYAGKKFFPSQFLNEINYKKNENIEYMKDIDEKYTLPKANVKTSLGRDMKISFSPSSLLLFDECQKKYEYKYIYNMPDPRPISWESIQLGSFVHHVIESGIKGNYKSEKDFIILAKSLQAEEKWSFVRLEDALPLIKIFFERNKGKYNEKSLTEVSLSANLDNMRFFGYADRIDFTPAGVEIIDYKTGNSNISPKARNIQLGFYALAASQKFGKVYKLTLDMLKKDKPIEFVIDEKGNALESISGRMSFNLSEVKEEIISTARKIIESCKSGFQPCPIEKNCDFCNEYVWGV